MKNKIISFLILVLIIPTGYIYAHEHHQNDSIRMSAADSLMQIEMLAHQQMEAVNAFPNYHPLIVHFPIVLILMAAVFQLLSFIKLKSEFSVATIILLTLGVISSWLANNTFHAMPGELLGKAKEIFKTHEQMATLTWWFSLTALLIKIPSHFFFKRKWWMEMTVTLLLIASSITVSIAGHHGAMLVHMEGIGPMGKYLESYKFKGNDSGKNLESIKVSNSKLVKEDESEEDHHIGEFEKGPHGGTIEEAEPNHIEIIANGKDLIFYLLDGDAKSLNMKNVMGNIKIISQNKSVSSIKLMEMNNKLTAMNVINNEPFKVVCILTMNGKSFSTSFDSESDLHISK